MATGGVSVISNNHKMESDADNFKPRAKRAPPPPPIVRVEPKSISSEPEIPPLPTENSINEHASLLSEFHRLFNEFDYESIREDILHRKLIQSNFITVLWRIFLHCLPRNVNHWDDTLDRNRRNYEKLRQQYTIDPYQLPDENHEGIHINHPLSRDENSAWAQYFADESLRKTILIDVQRTCPDISYFRDEHIMELQLRILFTHDRHHHSSTPYRQGMHEILGIIIYAIHTEASKINQYPDANELMKKLYNPEYLEHDAYALYENIMDHLRQFYALSTNNFIIRKSVSTHDTKQIPFQKLKDAHIPENETAKRMISIIENLKHCDRLLYVKLEELKIEPTVYGIRWLRLLFGREIPFQSIPSLWTVVFCFDEHFGFVEYFFIALLMEVGEMIKKQGDITHSQFLQILMQQNLIINVEPVIRKALNLTGRRLTIPPGEVTILPKSNADRSRNNSAEDEKEEKNQGKFVRVPLTRTTESRWIGPISTPPEKSISPPRVNPPENQIDAKKLNSSNDTPSSQASKINSPYVALEPDMEFFTGKPSSQLYKENIQMQKCCAQYMNSFIERLQKRLNTLKLPHDDDLQLPITGLKQIANVLDHKIPFDAESLQSIVDFPVRDKSE